MLRLTRVRRIGPLSHQTSGRIASTTTEKQRKHDFYLTAKKFVFHEHLSFFFFNKDKKYEVSGSSSEQKSL